MNITVIMYWITFCISDMQNVNIFIKKFWKVWIDEISKGKLVEEISKGQNKDKNWYTKMSNKIYLLSYK